MDTNTEPVNPHTKEPEMITRSITKPRKLIISNVHLRGFIDPVTLAEVVEFIESLDQSIIDLPLDRLLPLAETLSI
ncbi:Serine/threonine-protein phosphatase 2A activator [Puccinia graminis f. sp. tritici]|uniref:Serine/threonine-protein phosphatase 2A activator n=1 Tax=Puccinia graminis f. sp. tritici TaxID=56615 RepID=A0A5B0RAK1_PUCGR|nr:Serine/threonine-protein phosphatase 2A activator [Puccinia graminis f. sp. tritici]